MGDGIETRGDEQRCQMLDAHFLGRMMRGAERSQRAHHRPRHQRGWGAVAGMISCVVLGWGSRLGLCDRHDVYAKAGLAVAAGHV